MNKLGLYVSSFLLALLLLSSTIFVVDQRQYGVVYSLGQIKKVMTGLRASPPSSILNKPVLVDDYLIRTGHERTDALIFTGQGLKVIFRPSGTEPKLKCYLQFTGSDTEKGLEDLKLWARELIQALS